MKLSNVVYNVYFYYVTLNNSTMKATITKQTVKLPNNFQICQLGWERFALEYTDYGFEPTPAKIEKIAVQATELLNKYRKELKAKNVSKPSVYVRRGDVAIGIMFSSKMDDLEMESVINKFDIRA